MKIESTRSLASFEAAILLTIFFVAQLAHTAELSATQQSQTDSKAKHDIKVCWFPFPRGTTATCIQGPFSTSTHRGGYAWDFGLKEGTPILAPADGRVILVVDNHTQTGIRPKGTSPADIANYQKTSMENSNQIAIDHGDGSYSFFWHHKGGTARVRTGDIVAAGTHIADVGMSGTYIPHICFSMGSPASQTPGGSCDVRFRTGENSKVSVKTGQRCLSATPETKNPPQDFQPSTVQGREFAANGVLLKGGQPLFSLQADQDLVFEGQTLERAKVVGLYIWKPGQTSEFVQTVVPDASGAFQLKARIPITSRGSRCYTIAITTPNGKIKYPAATHVLVY